MFCQSDYGTIVLYLMTKHGDQNLNKMYNCTEKPLFTEVLYIPISDSFIFLFLIISTFKEVY